MGDRYILSLNCAYCDKKNDDIWYAPTSNSYTFKCQKCGKLNFIISNFGVKKIEDATLEDIKKGFEMTTNVAWKEEEIDEMCKETLNSLKEEDELREIMTEKLKKIKEGK